MTLTELRESKGLSREWVAGAVGITYHGVRKIEMGGDTYISTLERYADALKVSVCDVLEAHRQSRPSTAPAREVVTIG